MRGPIPIGALAKMILEDISNKRKMLDHKIEGGPEFAQVEVEMETRAEKELRIEGGPEYAEVLEIELESTTENPEIKELNVENEVEKEGR